MRLLGSVVLVVGICAIAHAATAQTSGEDADEEGARFLVSQGLELVEQEDWSRAADRFRTALRMRPSPTIRYHLARSLLELGQLTEAEELVVAIQRAPNLPDEVRRGTEELAERIPAAGGKLTIRLTGADDAQVFMDDRRLPASRMGVEITASIGVHVVEARRDHDVLVREDVDVSHDTPSEVVLEVTEADAFVLEGSGSAGEDAAGDGGGLLGDWRFWAIVGGGVVAVAVAVAVIAVASSSTMVEEPIVGDFQPGVLTWE